MARTASGTERLSAYSAFASAAIAVLATVTAMVSAFAAINASNRIAEVQQHNAARAEISNYVVEMGQYDQDGGSIYRNEIATLAKQVDTLINIYGQDSLNLSPSAYRLTGLYTSLSTAELELAASMERRALSLATKRVPDGSGGTRMADPFEALQSHRVLADIAAQNLDLTKMVKEYEAALHISATEGDQSRYIGVEASRYTRAYRALSAMMLVDNRPPTSAQCAMVRKFAFESVEDFKYLGKENPELARRALRIKDNACQVPVDLEPLKKAAFQVGRSLAVGG
ncbi:hypothetical protein SGFS_083410 [Streptomyces graminofaciens]|uniref:Secreted protein n=1 Tax=Streptomyces graminofaciens TaxID=68212 RepID=A0ABM7FKI2_9ACTN|nr:hypothetical protein [Streptomyces graminofaciens]BBC37047.1 hypothetical protein SGFS_083410 [Streptomyces graminofaciens]